MRRQGRGEITSIKSLLDRYKQVLKPPQSSVVKEFAEVVSDLMQIEIKPKQVSYAVRDRVLFLKTPGLITQEIKLRKPEILAHLKGRLGEHHAPKDIQ